MTTPVTLCPTPILQFFNNAGAPNINGTILTQVGGVNTTCYQDSAGSIALPNPIPLNSRGEVSNSSGLSCQLFLQNGLVYVFTLFDANGNQLDQAQYVAQPSAASQASIGALLYPQTAAELAASVTPINLWYAPGNINRYATNSTPGTTDMSMAFSNAVLQALKGGAAVYAPGGTYAVSYTFSGVCTQIVIYGDGPEATVFTQTSPTADVFAWAAAAQSWGITFRDFSVIGVGASTAGYAFHFPSGLSFPPYLMEFANITMRGFVACFLDVMGLYDTVYDRIIVSSTNGHGLETQGGNSVLFRNCYPSATKIGDSWAGIRVHVGRPTFLNCTGISSGDYHYIFSDSTVAGDATNAYCFPTFIGCDSESFSVASIWNRQGSANIIDCSVISTVANTIGMIVWPYNQAFIGTLDNDNTFTNGAGWKNGAAVHVQQTVGKPFNSVGSPAANGQYSYYDETQSLLVPMSVDQQAVIRTNRYAKSFYDLYVTGLLKLIYSGTMTFAGTTSQAVSFSGLSIPAAPDGSYKVLYGMNATSSTTILVPWTTSKGTSGFTINVAAAYTGTIDWMCVF